jgi:hypothetical protein
MNNGGEKRRKSAFETVAKEFFLGRKKDAAKFINLLFADSFFLFLEVKSHYRQQYLFAVI